MRTTSIVAGSVLVASQALASIAPRQPYAYPAKPGFKRGTDGCTTTAKIAPKILVISMVCCSTEYLVGDALLIRDVVLP